MPGNTCVKLLVYLGITFMIKLSPSKCIPISNVMVIFSFIGYF